MSKTRQELWEEICNRFNLDPDKTMTLWLELEKRVQRDNVLRDQLLKACKAAKNAMGGSHGPCKNNSCSDCRATWKRLQSVIAEAEEEKQ
jgi:hypothetical protein